MNTRNKKLGLLVTVVTLVLAVAPKVFAASDTFFGVNITDFMASFFANMLSNLVFTVASFSVYITGILLNVGMYFTTHIGMFVDSSPVIYTVWTIIRDISSLFLIFFILWAAIQMILGLQSPKFGQLIKNIVIIGILINFSFFFTRILIDASNIVSLEFYNAMAPTNSASLNCDKSKANNECSSISEVAKKIANNGGLSNIFMSSLKITSWYDGDGKLTKDATGALATKGDFGTSVDIILITFFGSITMLLASASFLVAGAAAIFRLAVLVLLLAFSPIWIASWAIPQLNDFAKRWTNQLKTQLIFLPVYLGLMYVVIRIISESNLNNITSASASGLSSVANIVVGFSIILVMINLPLVAAASVAGSAGGWTDKMFGSVTKWGKGVLKAGPSALATSRIGPGNWASKIDDKIARTPIGNSMIGRDLRASTLGAVTKSKFGGTRSREDIEKLQKEIAKKGKEIGRTRAFGDAFNAAQGSATPANITKLKSTFGDLTEKEKIGLDVKQLTNPEIIKAMKKSEFDAIKKSDDITNEDKAAISKARTDVLNAAIAADPSGKEAKNMIRTMEGADLMKIYEKDPSKFNEPGLVYNLTSSHLKYLNENGLDDQKIKDNIFNLITGKLASQGPGGGTKHPAASWISDTNNNWL